MATYKVRSGEGLFDVAAKLYRGDTAGGIQDLLTLNPTINLDSDDLFGLELTYTASLNRSKEKFPEVEIREKTQVYTTRSKQTVFDLAVQLYGDVSQIRNLLEIFPNLDNEITVGSEVELSEQTDPIAVFFSERALKVATDITYDVTIDNARILEDGGYRLLEDGSIRLLE